MEHYNTCCTQMSDVFSAQFPGGGGQELAAPPALGTWNCIVFAAGTSRNGKDMLVVVHALVESQLTGPVWNRLAQLCRHEQRWEWSSCSSNQLQQGPLAETTAFRGAESQTGSSHSEYQGAAKMGKPCGFDPNGDVIVDITSQNARGNVRPKRNLSAHTSLRTCMVSCTVAWCRLLLADG